MSAGPASRAAFVASPALRLATAAGLALAGLLAAVACGEALAHNISGGNARFVEGVNGAAPGAFLYLGAKHMVTGLDHILFLVGVVFFLRRFRDVAIYVSLFTLGHSTTLLLGVLSGLKVNAFAIDAIIGLSVAWKAFENFGGFDRVLGVKVGMRTAVLVFGLFHGLGLATKLQELALSREGLLANLLCFNLGVELGQVLVLALVVAALGWARRLPGFGGAAFAANAVLLTAGLVLAGQQVAGMAMSGGT